MAEVALGDVMEVTIGYRVSQQQCLMVRHYQLKNTPAIVDYEDNLDAITNAILLGPTADLVPKLLPCMGAHATVNFVQVQGIAPLRRFYKRSNQNQDGTQPGVEPLPPNNSVVITLQPEVPGRGRSGSVHVGGLTTQTYTDAGFIDPDYVEFVENLGIACTQGIGGVAPNNYWKPIMYSPGVANGNLVIAATVQDTMRVMRRRTVGLGI